MTEFSRIEWTDYTHNPWWGCARVSPACVRCYADSQAARYGHHLWRKNGPRRMLSDANWAKPLRWNRAAQQSGTPAKVFCASMADVFEDHPDVGGARDRLWELIEQTPWLRWQLLTKRPENIAAMAPWTGRWPANVWIGVSVETQRFAEQRIPLLVEVPATVRFLSCEPLLGPLDLDRWLHPDDRGAPLLHWVIAGGESGPKARVSERDWFRDLVGDCAAADVPVFVKQLGTAWARDYSVGGTSLYAQGDRKGSKNLDAWPRELRVRAFPELMEVS